MGRRCGTGRDMETIYGANRFDGLAGRHVPDEPVRIRFPPSGWPPELSRAAHADRGLREATSAEFISRYAAVSNVGRGVWPHSPTGEGRTERTAVLPPVLVFFDEMGPLLVLFADLAEDLFEARDSGLVGLLALLGTDGRQEGIDEIVVLLPGRATDAGRED
jgi:hypothetical protein